MSGTTGNAARAPLRWAGIAGTAAAWFALAIFAASTAAAFLPVPWPFALVEHAKPHVSIWSGGFGLLMLVLRMWRIGAAALACAAFNYAAMAAVPFVTPEPAPHGTREIRIVWSNVAGNTPALNASLDYAREKQVDLVLIGEFPFGKALTAEFAPDYPYRADTGVRPDDPYRRTRVVALSRVPITNARTVVPGDASSRAFLIFDFKTGEPGKTIRVAAAHVLLPMRAFAHAAQPDFISALSDELEEPFLVAADLNATPWSQAYRLLPGGRVGDPKWRTTYVGRRAWPPTMTFMPIDHLIVSSDIGASALETGPRAGSNHFPLFAAIYLRE